jgi:hypothetical protein
LQVGQQAAVSGHHVGDLAFWRRTIVRRLEFGSFGFGGSKP